MFWCACAEAMNSDVRWARDPWAQVHQRARGAQKSRGLQPWDRTGPMCGRSELAHERIVSEPAARPFLTHACPCLLGARCTGPAVGQRIRAAAGPGHGDGPAAGGRVGPTACPLSSESHRAWAWKRVCRGATASLAAGSPRSTPRFRGPFLSGCGFWRGVPAGAARGRDGGPPALSLCISLCR